MSAAAKILKPVGSVPDALELAVAQNIIDLENNIPDLKADLRPIQITAAKQVCLFCFLIVKIDVGQGKQAILVFVPVPLLKLTHKIQSRLVRELEKKFSDKHVLIVAQRRIVPKPGRKSRVKQARPRSRTLTAVHEKLLEDLVYPTEIVGKRTKVRVDGSKVIKVYVLMNPHSQFPRPQGPHITRIQARHLFVCLQENDWKGSCL